MAIETTPPHVHTALALEESGPPHIARSLSVEETPVQPPDEWIPDPVAVELWQRLGPWYRRDLENPAHPLLVFCHALTSGLQTIEYLIRDTSEGVGWSRILDPDRAPTEWLPWLKQFPGLVNHDTSIYTEDQFREVIQSGLIQKRGSPDAIRTAPRPFLEEPKTVFLVERHGDEDHLTVAVRAAEVIDFDRIQRAVIWQKPAGIIMSIVQITGGDYITLAATHASYAALLDIYPSYTDILIDPARQ